MENLPVRVERRSLLQHLCGITNKSEGSLFLGPTPNVGSKMGLFPLPLVVRDTLKRGQDMTQKMMSQLDVGGPPRSPCPFKISHASAARPTSSPNGIFILENRDFLSLWDCPAYVHFY